MTLEEKIPSVELHAAHLMHLLERVRVIRCHRVRLAAVWRMLAKLGGVVCVHVGNAARIWHAVVVSHHIASPFCSGVLKPHQFIRTICRKKKEGEIKNEIRSSVGRHEWWLTFKLCAHMSVALSQVFLLSSFLFSPAALALINPFFVPIASDLSRQDFDWSQSTTSSCAADGAWMTFAFVCCADCLVSWLHLSEVIDCHRTTTNPCCWRAALRRSLILSGEEKQQ